MLGNTVHTPQQDPRSGYISSIEKGFGSSTSIGVSAPSIIDIPLNEVKFAGRVFELNAPIHVSLYLDFEGGSWACENQEFSILAFGNNVAQAIHSFSEDFEMTWDVIAKSTDDSLTVEAQKVKQAMLSVVKRIIER
jgi:hypothetical protein